MRLVPWQELNRWCLPTFGSPLIVSAQLEGKTGAQFFGLLSENEKARVSRLKNRAVAERWVITHGILRLVLGQILQMAPQRLKFGENRYQKPFLSCPADSNLSFNLSHSEEFLLIALTKGRRIGIDVERLSPDRDFAAIAPLVFSPEEQALLSCSSDPRLDFYTLWTAKEAILKATGRGFSFPPRQVQLTIKDTALTIVNLPVELSKDGACALTPFQPETGYAAAVAILNEPSGDLQTVGIAAPHLSRALVY
ncbi:MAG: 4'-phosphopantetheinyl transferase superfamily protein [Brevefilum sp.]|nr:4'-phosphopantetheinyl transferase superfamily protein [Brevefilum sp.]MDW7754990.1 4'-phosphopantetheinyl transferase superfamily protein [Brevefilum sp.]